MAPTDTSGSENHPKILKGLPYNFISFPRIKWPFEGIPRFQSQMARFRLLLVKVGLPHCACSDKEDNIPGYAGVVRTSKPLDMVSAKLLMEQRGFVVFRKLGRDKFLTCAYLSRKPSQHLDVFDVSFSSVPAVLHNSSNCSADPALLETRAVRGGFGILYGLSA